MTLRTRSVLGATLICAVLAFGGLRASEWYLAEAQPESTALQPPEPAGVVTALGRLEPKDGVYRIAGPSQPAVVIGDLLVDDGDRVEEGQVIAILDSHRTYRAAVARLQAELENARAELNRHDRLFRDAIVSEAERDRRRVKVRTLEAQLEQAEAELALTVVHSPISGQVLEVHARKGERVGVDGIAEIGRTDTMYAIAEVYETDIGRVKVGQRAAIHNPALAAAAHGTVERIGLKIGKKDILDTDPAARIDARVVEVEILLDHPEQVKGLTNLTVDVVIEP
jgi:HlyD family secretion protein